MTSGISEAKTVFGLHSVTPYDPETGRFYPQIDVLENSSLNLSVSGVPLVGGSSSFPYASSAGEATAEMTLTFGEFPPFLMGLLTGTPPEVKNSNLEGEVSPLKDLVGDLASKLKVTVKNKDNLKFAKYVVEAKSDSSLSVYSSSDVDFYRGEEAKFLQNGQYLGDVSGEDSSVAEKLGLGFSFEGKMTVGDTCTFTVYPPYKNRYSVKFGRPGSGSRFVEWGAILTAEDDSGRMCMIDVYRVIARGLPIDFARKTHAKPSITCNVMYSRKHRGVCEFNYIEESTVNTFFDNSNVRGE